MVASQDWEAGCSQQFLVRKEQALDRQVRRGTIDKNHPSLSVGAQCRLLSIARSSFYYELMGETSMNLDVMVKIDKQFVEPPFYDV